MLRTRLNKAHIKRTFRPLYGWTQMTPKSVFLDPGWTRAIDIFPGMVMARTVGENVTLIGPAITGPPAVPATAVPYGFAALYVGGDGIDEPLDAGINAFAVWVMGPDAEAEILAPAFDTASIGISAEGAGGTEVLLMASTAGANQGKLVVGGTAGTTAVARLLKVNSATKITIGGLR